MRDYRHIEIQLSTGDVIPLTPEDVAAFAAVNDTFPDSRLVEVKLPGKHRRPVFGSGRKNAKRR